MHEHAIAMLSRAITNYYAFEGSLTGKMQNFFIWLEHNRPELLNP